MRRYLLPLAILLFSTSTFSAEESSLEEQLDALSMPANQLPGAVSEEKLYSVQKRFIPLSKRHEVSLFGARDFAGDGYMDSNQLGLNYRYHRDDKWSIIGTYTRAFNELNDSGRILLEQQKLVSDSDYVISQFDVGMEYNLFYGKFRFGMDQVFYFDQYVALSGGVIELRRGISPVVSADVGLAFWAGKKMSVRVGAKNNFYQEQNGLGVKALARNMIGYMSFGYFFEGI